jgi:hypothetical protein
MERDIVLEGFSLLPLSLPCPPDPHAIHAHVAHSSIQKEDTINNRPPYIRYSLSRSMRSASLSMRFRRPDAAMERQGLPMAKAARAACSLGGVRNGVRGYCW